MMVERLFLAVPWGCLRFVIVVFPDYTHLLFLQLFSNKLQCTKLSYHWYQKVVDLPFLPPPPPPTKKKKKKDMVIIKYLWDSNSDSNSATFQGIFAIQHVDRLTKLVVVLSVMS